MKTSRSLFALFMMCSVVAWGADAPTSKAVPWSMNATIIEACSCPMFCQCYFNDRGAAHHDHSTGQSKHFCRFNNAYKVNKGYYGATKLDGAKFWFAGDQGTEWGDGEMEWAEATFDPSVTKEQREGIMAVLPHLYPLKVKKFTTAPDAPIEWMATADRAVGRLDGGKKGEIVLKSVAGMKSGQVVINNLKYWGAPRHDGFVLMPNEVEAYRVGPNAFEFRGTNGFMLTFDINSKDVAPKMAHSH